MALTKKSLSKEDTVSFFLKVPSPDRKKFSIVKRTTKVGCKPEYSTVDIPQVELINKLYQDGKKSLESAALELKEIIKGLLENEKKRRGDLITSEENHIVLKEYLDKKYPARKRREIDFKSVENETIRTLRALGNKSLLSASQAQLQACIDKLEVYQQKRYVSRLHSILKTLGRNDVELFYSRPKKNRVTHINKQDLDKLIKSIKLEAGNIAGISPNDFSEFITALFCTGCRIGEALALESIHFNKSKQTLKIEQQLKQDGSISDTKTKKDRRAVVINFGLNAVESWIELDKTHFSRYNAAKFLSKKTSELFTDKNKHISLHGLRHSYAIYLLRDAEVSLNSVAAFLGDSNKTTEDYYIDFIASDETIVNAVEKIKSVR